MNSIPDHVRSKAISFLKKKPNIWPTIQSLRGKTSGTFCSPETDLCVEGFESSANTYTFVVIRSLRPDLNIAHHTHSAAGVKLAIRYSIPILILFRDPHEAIPSVVTRFRPSVYESILNYINFYECVMKNADNVILSRFDEVIEDIGDTIGKIERQTAIEFGARNLKDIEEEAQAHIHNWTRQNGRMSSVALPKEEREQAKKEIRSELNSQEEFSRAVAVYEKINDIYCSRQSEDTSNL